MHYFLTYVTFLASLSHGKGTKNTCKIDATVNFFSVVAGNFIVKTKRKSNLESYHFILCFTISAYYYIILFETPQIKSDSILIDTKIVSSSSKIIKTEYILEINH